MKAHSRSDGLIRGSADFLLREGNCHADAAAKTGLECRDIDLKEVNAARMIEALV